ncbi:MAG: DNA mismatch repair protein MutS [Bdellovibrionales bacterium GWB1_55_8]|nr:MAG: DNA mismatch repair protein MutS [Bdellovibrionales bacterium GWB1_55_8]
MKQYHALKAQADGAMLLFRMGDFYELFGDDAVEAARILEITLTTRDRNKPNPVPMAGVPHHSVQGYIQRLLKAGKKVAIGEQMEDPAVVGTKGGPKIVRREIIRMFTPGVQFDLEGNEANYLAAIAPGGPGKWALACLDVSTGETLISGILDSEALAAEISALPIRQLLQGEGSGVSSTSDVLIENLPPNYISDPQAQDLLRHHYAVDRLDAFIPDSAAVRALGTVVLYALRTQQQEVLPHLRPPVPLRKPRALILGPRAAQHLDLVAGADAAPNLFDLINGTRSAIGARQLKRWLLAPLAHPEDIAARQFAVRELASASSRLEKLTRALVEVYDIERILGRVSTGLANPRDTLALGRSLSVAPMLLSALEETNSTTIRELSERIHKVWDKIRGLAERITSSQREEAPLISRDGGIFNRGVSPELDRLLSLSNDGQRWLIELETREREATGIPSLKVRYNRVFGYYIEVTQAHLKSVPDHYQRKQTTVGAERFFTEELKKFEDDFVNASSRQKALEQELFSELLQAVRAQTADIMDSARALAELDALHALAKLADQLGWSFPKIDDSLDLEIQEGRHALVDAGMRGGFVPNDLRLSAQSRLTLIITGPNMGGKSTVMRQTALIVILGQMGAPIPASSASWGAVSSIYTRIGAQDAIARGQSTFMVEMSELAHILHYADERSLIVLDEIGRGTSTYDGISVAWASLEWLCTRIRARTLFATHYHELTRLTSSLPLAANVHMAVEGGRELHEGKLRFLYKVREGAANESFGIHVARIAGLPRSVVSRAWKVLEELEKHSPDSTGLPGGGQLSLFDSADPVEETSVVSEPVFEQKIDPVLEEIQNANLNEMTPLQALNFIARLQEISRGSVEARDEVPNPPPPGDR